MAAQPSGWRSPSTRSAACTGRRRSASDRLAQVARWTCVSAASRKKRKAFSTCQSMRSSALAAGACAASSEEGPSTSLGRHRSASGCSLELPLARFCSAPAAPPHQMRPSQCAIAIRTTRVSGAISTGARKTIAARPFQCPQIGLDQGQRKEGRARFPRQICHMLPARDEACADFVAQAGKQARDLASIFGRRAAPVASHRRPRGATAAAAPGPGTECAGGRAAAAPDRKRGRSQLPPRRWPLRRPEQGCARPERTGRLRFSTSDYAARRRRPSPRRQTSSERASIMSSEQRRGSAWRPSRGAQGIGDRVAGTRGLVCRLQRIAPPLQADLADRRLAAGDIGHAGDLGRERGQGQQAAARCRRSEQGRKVAVGLAGAGGGDDGVGSSGRPASAGGHVSRGAPPPPWRASPARRG